MKKFLLHIPEPCHEDWNQMTQADKGRYCNSCCKTVVDFTFMSDQQIINYFSNAPGRTCGHFANDQLNRVLREPAAPAKKNIWAMMLSFMLPVFASNKAAAQGKVCVKADTVKVEEEPKPIVYGNVMRTDFLKTRQITGKVTNQDGLTLEGVTVMVEGTARGVTTNAEGIYRITIDTDKKQTLLFSFVGYDIKSMNVSLNNEVLCVTLNQSDNYVEGDVLIIPYKKASVKKKIVDTLIAKFDSVRISVFPNPAVRGEFITIKIKNIGSYDCYLIDMQGNIINTSAIQKRSKNEAQLKIPTMIATGIYSVTVYDKKSKKKHSEKIIVQ